MPAPDAQQPRSPETAEGSRRGVLYGFGAFIIWGAGPVYFRQLTAVPAFEIVAHRLVWAAAFAAFLVVALQQGSALRCALARRNLAVLAVTAALITVNWSLYIWAVNAGYIVETSLGYFINPLVNVALGMLFLGERLRRLQKAAVFCAAVGVLIETLAADGVPWIALVLAVSFGFYGLLRKTVHVEALAGFAVESLLLLPGAVVFLLWLGLTGGAVWPNAGPFALSWLALSGVFTALPLIWFSAAARKLKLSTIGLMQYLAPSLQLASGVLIYGEPFGRADAAAFGAIWTGLALYSVDAWRNAAGVPAPSPAARASSPPARPGGTA